MALINLLLILDQSKFSTTQQKMHASFDCLPMLKFSFEDEAACLASK
jgi:hypothetical protein